MKKIELECGCILCPVNLITKAINYINGIVKKILKK